MYRSDDEISNRPNWNAQAYRAYLAYEGIKNNAEAREQFFDRYRGEWDSEEAYTEDFYYSVQNMDEVPEWCRDHIDWESLANEMFSSDCYSDDSSPRGVYVFINC